MALAQIQRLLGFSGSAVWCQRCGVSQLLCGAGAGGSHEVTKDDNENTNNDNEEDIKDDIVRVVI